MPLDLGDATPDDLREAIANYETAMHSYVKHSAMWWQRHDQLEDLKSVLALLELGESKEWANGSR